MEYDEYVKGFPTSRHLLEWEDFISFDKITNANH